MKILTKKKQKEVLARMVANAVIATDAFQYAPSHVHNEGRKNIEWNLEIASYIIGGKDGMEYAMDKFDRGLDFLKE